MAEHPIFREIVGGFIAAQRKADELSHAERMLRHQEREAERKRLVDDAVALAFEEVDL